MPKTKKNANFMVDDRLLGQFLEVCKKRKRTPDKVIQRFMISTIYDYWMKGK